MPRFTLAAWARAREVVAPVTAVTLATVPIARARLAVTPLAAARFTHTDTHELRARATPLDSIDELGRVGITGWRALGMTRGIRLNRGLLPYRLAMGT